MQAASAQEGQPPDARQLILAQTCLDLKWQLDVARKHHLAWATGFRLSSAFVFDPSELVGAAEKNKLTSDIHIQAWRRVTQFTPRWAP